MNTKATAQEIVEIIERHQSDIPNVFGCRPYRMSLPERIDTVKYGLDKVLAWPGHARSGEWPAGPEWVKQGTSIQEIGRGIYELMLAAIPHDARDAEQFMLDLLWELEANHGFPGMYNEHQPYPIVPDPLQAKLNN